MSRKIVGNTVGTTLNPEKVQVKMPDMSDYVKNTDYATASKNGVVKVDSRQGISISQSSGVISIVSANESEIVEKSSGKKPITPSVIDYAVKKALSDCKLEGDDVWTEEEKASARETLGTVGKPTGTGVPIWNGKSLGCVGYYTTIPKDNQFPRADGKGRLATNTPEYNSHCANKGYVDDLVSQHDIITKASGEVVTTTDSAKVKPKNIKLFGKSKQDGTPSMETPIVPVHHGESGSIGGKVLTENLLDGNKFIENGFNKVGENEYYVQNNNTVYEKVVFKNSCRIKKQLKITGSVKWVHENTIGSFPKVFYTDGSILDVIVETKEFNNYIKFSCVTDSEKVVDHIEWSYGTGSAETYIKDMQISLVDLPSFSPYTEQPFTVLTPNGLRGIPLGTAIPDEIKNSPIHMHGVYWDNAEGQYYIGDTKNENGKDVQRIQELILDGTEVWSINVFASERNVNAYHIVAPFDIVPSLGLCTHLINKVYWYDGLETDTNVFWIANTRTIVFKTDGIETLETFKSRLANEPIKISVVLNEPIVTESTDNYDVVMNYPNTTIVNDEGAYMEVEYVADTKCYIDNKFKELAVALANTNANLL